MFFVVNYSYGWRKSGCSRNSQDILDATQFFIEREGFIFTPILSGEITSDEILARIQELEPPASIVLTGVRNMNDHDYFDISGLNLARKLKAEGRKVIVFSSPDYKGDADRLGIPFVGKAEGPVKTVEKIKEILAATPNTSG